ncbi:hypothetical protein [Geovibrio ferrireducens]|uniref:hypothetical protein n=1 Tax=Geovibrio ferrireducens TaxID=46201 RepID=UPI0022485782|nr:hypothetical protein [Geovibrio ferrireducens]
MSLKRIKLPECPIKDAGQISRLLINGAYVARGIIRLGDGEYQIAPAVFQHKPEKDGRGIYYPSMGFVIPLPDEYKRAFAAVPAEQLPLNVSVEF